MNFIIFDVEATCWEKKCQQDIMETIEIGALKISDGPEIVDRFDQFIKPIVNPRLSRFCVELTGIHQKVCRIRPSALHKRVFEFSNGSLSFDDEIEYAGAYRLFFDENGNARPAASLK